MWAIPWLIALGFAGERPTNELLDDLDRWHDGMDAMLAGPPGCWEFAGTSKQLLRVHRGPDMFSAATEKDYAFDGTFSGRLEDGVWHDLKQVVKATEEEGDDVYIPAAPLMGRMEKSDTTYEEGDVSLSITIDDDGSSVEGSMLSGVNLLQEAVDNWAGSTEISVARWDAANSAVVLERDIPVSEDDKRTIRVETRFPDAGAQAARIDAVWPRLVKLGSWPVTLKIRDAQMHMLGYQHEALVLPQAESISLTASALGFTASYEQQLTFTSATACVLGAAASAEDTDAAEGAEQTESTSD